MTSLSLEDAVIPQSHYSIKLKSFEGPLDLLLYLIRRDEIDIYDIPIGVVTSQYLEYLESCEKKNLELTGEFFVMAATLMVIKSRMLLPKHEQTEEEETPEEDDPRWELVQQLLHYKKIKEDAERLEALIINNHDVLPRIVELHASTQNTRPLKNSDRIELWNVFNKILTQLSKRLVVGEIHDEYHTVADRMTFIIDKLHINSHFYFTQLVEDCHSIDIIVNTFLAMLELTRLKVLYLEQTANFKDILCKKRELVNLSEKELDSEFI